MCECKISNEMKARKSLVEMRNSSSPIKESVNGSISQSQKLILK